MSQGGALETSATILVVDDLPANRYLLDRWLRGAGYATAEAATGGEAVRLCRELLPDLVLLDVKLPDMSGYEVCERIKDDPPTAAMPVVHLSANAKSVADRAAGLHRGADAYLTEPVEREELLATIEAVLRYSRARQRAERLVAWLSGLNSTTIAVKRHANLPGLLAAAAKGVGATFDTTVAVAAATQGGESLCAVIREKGATPQITRLDPSVLTRLTRGSSLPVVQQVHPGAYWAPLLPWPVSGKDVLSVVVRQKALDAPVGILLPADALDAGDTDCQQILHQFGQSITLSVETLRNLDQERDLALTLQRSLLPQRVPATPGYRVAVRYVPASAHAEIGGDFYEILRLDGKLHIAIGDIGGHSLHAATIMAEVRHALRAYLLEGHGPAATLELLNQVMLGYHQDEIATACLVTLDLATGRGELASAGHMPPLLVRPDGRGVQLQPRGPLLGVDLPRPGPSAVELPAGHTLLLFTDGLVERRWTSIDDGLGALAETVAALGRTPHPDVLCDHITSSLDAGPGRQEDDIALIAIQR